MRELVVQTKGVERFEERGWICRKVVYTGRKGAPDFWCLRAGIWALVEFKRLGEPPTAQQQKEHDRLRGQGQRVWVIDNIPDAYALVDRLDAEVAAARAR